MASIIVIPIIIVAIAGLSGYLAYKFVLYDQICKRNVNQTLRKYDIKKTPAQIIKEYYEFKGESKSDREIQKWKKTLDKMNQTSF